MIYKLEEKSSRHQEIQPWKQQGWLSIQGTDLMHHCLFLTLLFAFGVHLTGLLTSQVTEHLLFTSLLSPCLHMANLDGVGQNPFLSGAGNSTPGKTSEKTCGNRTGILAIVFNQLMN